MMIYDFDDTLPK